eukprot:SAG11_NODE_1616_length_4577_cov_1.568781_6_plen_352_part_00
MSKALVKLECHTADGKEFKLEVGSHSPIWVIKEELERLTGHPPSDQILCLLNDKGDEGELLENQDTPISHCGIRSGSVLFLSYLTVEPNAPTPRQAKRAAEAALQDAAATAAALAARSEQEAEERARAECKSWCAANMKAKVDARSEAVRQVRALHSTVGIMRLSQNCCDISCRQAQAKQLGEPVQGAPAATTVQPPFEAALLRTSKPPQRAEHSYNGVMFDVQTKPPYEVLVNSLHVGGMLGTMSVRTLKAGSYTRVPGEPSFLTRNIHRVGRSVASSVARSLGRWQVFACDTGWCSDPSSLRNAGYGHTYSVTGAWPLREDADTSDGILRVPSRFPAPLKARPCWSIVH